MDTWRDQLIRWEKNRRDQFTWVTNLLLGLATGLLAFLSAALLREDFSDRAALCWALVSLFGLSLSIVGGMCCAIVRLYDFRGTVEKIRAEKDEKDTSDEDFSKRELRTLGVWSWRLLWVQLGVFLLAALCGALAVAIQVWPWHCCRCGT